MKSNLYIGLSGGIASGKTIVSDEFSSLGADIIDTDIIARELIFPGSETLNEIVSVFGENVLMDDGNLNRKLMRQIIFSEKDKKITLEKIMHPKIQNKVKLKNTISIRTLSNNSCPTSSSISNFRFYSSCINN